MRLYGQIWCENRCWDPTCRVPYRQSIVIPKSVTNYLLHCFCLIILFSQFISALKCFLSLYLLVKLNSNCAACVYYSSVLLFSCICSFICSCTSVYVLCVCVFLCERRVVAVCVFLRPDFSWRHVWTALYLPSLSAVWMSAPDAGGNAPAIERCLQSLKQWLFALRFIVVWGNRGIPDQTSPTCLSVFPLYFYSQPKLREISSYTQTME